MRRVGGAQPAARRALCNREAEGVRLADRLELGDAQAMDPSRPLSSAGDLVIEARISRSGDAMRRSGDEFGVSTTVRAGSRDVVVRIDQKVP
jgi:cytochrome c-type biogenesis protein CcmH